MEATTTFRNKRYEGLVLKGQEFRATLQRARDLENAQKAEPAAITPPAPVARQTRDFRPTFCLVTALWGRQALADLVLSQLELLRGQCINVIGVAAGSEPWCREVAEAHGWNYVTAVNRPLSSKWQTAVSAARTLDPDAVTLLGSDDLLNANFFDLAAYHLEHFTDCFEIRELYIFDTLSSRLVFFPDIYMGLGRTFSRSLLGSRDWQAYNGAVDRGLDMNNEFCMNLRKCEREIQRKTQLLGVAAVDIKTAVNMWSLKELLRLNPRARASGMIRYKHAPFFESFFPKLWPTIQQIQAQGLFGR